MKFMAVSKTNEAYEAGEPPSPELIASIGAFAQRATEAGVLLQTEGLLPSSQGARLNVVDGTVEVTDGPFAEAKELIAGFAILDVKSLDEAIEWTKQFIEASDVTEVDIRPVAEY